MARTEFAETERHHTCSSHIVKLGAGNLSGGLEVNQVQRSAELQVVSDLELHLPAVTTRHDESACSVVSRDVVPTQSSTVDAAWAQDVLTAGSQ